MSKSKSKLDPKTSWEGLSQKGWAPISKEVLVKIDQITITDLEGKLRPLDAHEILTLIWINGLQYPSVNKTVWRSSVPGVNKNMFARVIKTLRRAGLIDFEVVRKPGFKGARHYTCKGLRKAFEALPKVKEVKAKNAPRRPRGKNGRILPFDSSAPVPETQSPAQPALVDLHGFWAEREKLSSSTSDSSPEDPTPYFVKENWDEEVERQCRADPRWMEVAGKVSQSWNEVGTLQGLLRELQRHEKGRWYNVGKFAQALVRKLEQLETESKELFAEQQRIESVFSPDCEPLLPPPSVIVEFAEVDQIVSAVLAMPEEWVNALRPDDAVNFARAPHSPPVEAAPEVTFNPDQSAESLQVPVAATA